MFRCIALACLVTVTACTVPLRPDRPELSRFDGPAAPGTDVTITPLYMGKQTVPLCASAAEASCFEFVDSVHVAYLLRHPKGNVLIDTGVSARGPEEAASFPFPQNMVLRYEHEQGLGEALARAGSPAIDWVVLTHAHWDHASGLADLENPTVLLGPNEHEFARTHGMEHGVIQSHLDGITGATVQFSGPPVENFPKSFDLFEDGSIVLVPMEGHTPGHMGVLVSRVAGKRLMFVGDAAWSNEAIRIPCHKLKPASDAADLDPDTLSDQLRRLHHLRNKYPDMLFVPTHDAGSLEAIRKLASN